MERLPWPVVHGVLLRVGRGSTFRDVGVEFGVSFGAVKRLVDEYGFMCIRERKPRQSSLTLADRVEIQVGIREGVSFAEIGRRIGRPRQTVSTEVNRHGGRDRFQADVAEVEAGWATRRVRPRWFETKPDVWDEVQQMLRALWSPEQIARSLREMHPDDRYWWVSHESIYQAIYVQAKGTLKAELVACLRTQRDRRKPQTGQRGGRDTNIIPDMVNISQRPPEVTDRAVPGHWEGDLIVGKGNRSFVATLVERSSRFGMLVKVDSKQADHVAQRLAQAAARLPQHLMKSLTWDQGREMADHAVFTTATNIDVYFCDPKSPWQRGTNENWNGLVRQYLPKGTDLSIHTQHDLDAMATSLNTRPRKTLGWRNPAEVFNEYVTPTT